MMIDFCDLIKSFPFHFLQSKHTQGLPPEWAIMLSCSGLSEEEKAQHPDFVLKVLDFQQKQIHKEVELDDDSLSDSDDESDDEPPPNIPSRPPPPSAAKQGSSVQLKGPPPGGAPSQSQNKSGPSSPPPAGAPPASKPPGGEVTLRELLSHQDPRKIYTDFQEIGKGYERDVVDVWICFEEVCGFLSYEFLLL